MFCKLFLAALQTNYPTYNYFYKTYTKPSISMILRANSLFLMVVYHPRVSQEGVGGREVHEQPQYGSIF